MYQAIRSSTSIRRLADGACIPRDPSNRDYRGFIEWEAAGGVLLPADPAPAPTADELDEAAALGYAKLRALAGMTQAEIDAWVLANVTNLIGAQDAIKTLAKGMSVLLRAVFGQRARG
jgi:hypothetical protein